MSELLKKGDRVKCVVESVVNYPGQPGDIFTMARDQVGKGCALYVEGVPDCQNQLSPDRFRLHARAGEFVVGDKVVALKGFGDMYDRQRLTEGKVYTVNSVKAFGYTRHNVEIEACDAGFACHWPGSEFFRLATPEEIAAAEPPAQPEEPAPRTDFTKFVAGDVVIINSGRVGAGERRTVESIAPNGHIREVGSTFEYGYRPDCYTLAIPAGGFLAGDLVEGVVTDESCRITAGKRYLLGEEKWRGKGPSWVDDNGCDRAAGPDAREVTKRFRLISRPDADGWHAYTGSEDPAPDASIECRMKRGDVFKVDRACIRWDNAKRSDSMKITGFKIVDPAKAGAREEPIPVARERDPFRPVLGLRPFPYQRAAMDALLFPSPVSLSLWPRRAGKTVSLFPFSFSDSELREISDSIVREAAAAEAKPEAGDTVADKLTDARGKVLAVDDEGYVWVLMAGCKRPVTRRIYDVKVIDAEPLKIGDEVAYAETGAPLGEIVFIDDGEAVIKCAEGSGLSVEDLDDLRAA